MNVSNADPPELDDYRARIERAREHYQRFGELWAGYLERRQHRLVMDVGAGGDIRVRIVREEAIPAELSLVLGEFLYQLRAALDNCLYAVAEIDSGQSPPPNADLLEWPICLTPEKWRSNARRFAALSPELRQALEAIQPYQAEQPAWNCLGILHDLARVDRHRALHFVTMYGSYGNAKVDLNRIADFEPRIGVVDQDAVVATFRWLSDDHHINPDNFDLNVEFEIEMAGVVDSPHPATGRPQRPWAGSTSGYRHFRRRSSSTRLV